MQQQQRNLFSGVTVTTDKLPPKQREKVFVLIQYFGGTFKGRFDKSCTHVIADKSSGKIVDAAKQLQQKGYLIHIVNPDWINDSIAHGCRMDELPYTLVWPQRPKPSPENIPSVANTASFDWCRNIPQFLTGTVFLIEGYDDDFGHDIYAQLRVLGADVATAFETDRCTHLMTEYRTGPLYAAVVAYNAQNAAESDDRRRQIATVTTRWLHDSIYARKALPIGADVLYEPIRDAHGIPSISGNTVVSLTGYFGPLRARIVDMVDAVGAVFAPDLRRGRTTHLVCWSFAGEKYSKARDWGNIKIVNHRWLHDCIVHWTRMPEENYTRPGEEVEREASAVIQEHRGDIEGTANRTPQTRKRKRIVADSDEETQASEPENTISKGPPAPGTIDKKNRTVKLSNEAEVSLKQEGSEKIQSPPSKRRRTESDESASAMHTESHVVPAEPIAREQRKRIFSFSGVSESTVRTFVRTIERLGGECATDGGAAHTLDERVTHVIMPEPPKRTEKFLAACAAGLWVLRPAYLHDSGLKGEFVSEEPYEFADDVHITPQLWCKSPQRWRKHREATGQRAFEGIRIFLFGDTHPDAGIVRRIIKAGGGEVVDSVPPAGTGRLDVAATMAVIETNAHRLHYAVVGEQAAENTTQRKLLAKLVELGVPCARGIFVADTVSKRNLPNLYDEEYKMTLLKSSSPSTANNKKR